MSVCHQSNIQQTFGAHVHQEVDDAEIGHESVFVGKDLIICRLAGLHLLQALGLYRIETHELTDRLDELGIELDEALLMAFVDGEKLILIVLEVGTVVVGGLQGVPMLMAPIAVLAQSDFTYLNMRCGWLFDGNRKCQRAVGGIDRAMVHSAALAIDCIVGEWGHSFGYPLVPPTDWG